MDQAHLMAHRATIVPVKALMPASNRRAVADLRKVRQDIERADSPKISSARIVRRACSAFHSRICRCGAPSTAYLRVQSDAGTNRPLGSRIQFAVLACRSNQV